MNTGEDHISKARGLELLGGAYFAYLVFMPFMHHGGLYNSLDAEPLHLTAHGAMAVACLNTLLPIVLAYFLWRCRHCDLFLGYACALSLCIAAIAFVRALCGHGYVRFPFAVVAGPSDVLLNGCILIACLRISMRYGGVVVRIYFILLFIAMSAAAFFPPWKWQPGSLPIRFHSRQWYSS